MTRRWCFPCGSFPQASLSLPCAPHGGTSGGTGWLRTPLSLSLSLPWKRLRQALDDGDSSLPATPPFCPESQVPPNSYLLGPAQPKGTRPSLHLPLRPPLEEPAVLLPFQWALIRCDLGLCLPATAVYPGRPHLLGPFCYQRFCPKCGCVDARDAGAQATVLGLLCKRSREDLRVKRRVGEAGTFPRGASPAVN